MGQNEECGLEDSASDALRGRCEEAEGQDQCIRLLWRRSSAQSRACFTGGFLQVRRSLCRHEGTRCCARCFLIQLLSRVRLFATPWTAARQVPLSFPISQSLLKLMSIESVMPSNHLVLCRPLLLLPSVFPSIRVFSNQSVLHIRWPKDWSFSFSISPSNDTQD